jgi:transcription-repair coupling factor (superfamily II helicase)
MTDAIALPSETDPETSPSGSICKQVLANALGCSRGLALAETATTFAGMVLAVTPDTPTAALIEAELRFFAPELPLLVFPDWETLPYDVFSPHQDIVSRRLAALARLRDQRRGVLVVPVATLMQRLAPRSWLDAHCVVLRQGERLEPTAFRRRLEASAHRCVSQVREHGEFAVRGSLLDLYPMGCDEPFRIDLFDDEIESIRTFDPENQRTTGQVERIELLPAREFPLDEAAIVRFRRAFRSSFHGDPQASPVYLDVSAGIPPGGVEYYLPLFFDRTETLFDYLPEQCLAVTLDGVSEAATAFRRQAEERYEQRRHDLERPLLAPDTLFLDPASLTGELANRPRLELRREPLSDGESGRELPARALPDVTLHHRAPEPAADLHRFLELFPGRVLFTAESPGRREVMLETLQSHGVQARVVAGWQAFLTASISPAVTVTPLQDGTCLGLPDVAIISESQLEAERARVVRRRSARRDLEGILSDLDALEAGAPVVHEQHGVGRYRGLEILDAGGVRSEYLLLEYAGGDKLYVPVAALQQVRRYTGGTPETAPLHRLGSEQWRKARRKAAERVRDVAAELLDVYARRSAREGHAFTLDEREYRTFADGFPFEETADQAAAIATTIRDMTGPRPMDRVVCGDVGFGKTEVALRAAFVAVQGGRQVAVMVPTTLLAQQHYQNFLDRFADWPFNIEVISRFRGRKEQDLVLERLVEGKVDILIGTHKLLQATVRFARLGLVIVDEEHRFGVRHKERLKALRSEVDILTMTATPIPRTLSMSMTGLRDLSIIATPPAERLAVKTFVGEWNDALIQEACQRELKRGGQVYFVHNAVETIERRAKELTVLVPEARIAIAHGQMRERELEKVMLDFYHQRNNVLVCTTIIESGIDVPNANTIVIDRADRFGLAQLHQLRGRVGRSHHRAYAYLVTPPRKLITANAVKRLDAIESMDELGAGFVLASHDLEIRGAGELLGEEQSGHIQEIGFSLYSELLERAVDALRAGLLPDLDSPIDTGPEVELGVPALLPEDYLPDVHTRLIMYKRIASAEDLDTLEALQVEMIDRFGLLPAPAKTLFRIAELKLRAGALGVVRMEAGSDSGRLVFGADPKVDVGRVMRLIQEQGNVYRLDGKDRLRFAQSMPDAASRLSTLGRLLDDIAA